MKLEIIDYSLNHNYNRLTITWPQTLFKFVVQQWFEVSLSNARNAWEILIKQYSNLQNSHTRWKLGYKYSQKWAHFFLKFELFEYSAYH